ncbi:MAG: hypothetical protein SV062_14340 [Thermodesulfobacteriota bacterium]|nr:hypothetical protein [Thermodesulfobacteriota bacterium]
MSSNLAAAYALLGILIIGAKHGYDIYSYFSTHLNQLVGTM